ncbi:MAG: hypothetical protein ACPHSD_12470 [Candidatus Latescibacterota bacterium]
MKKYYVQLMALSAAFFLLSCDRERSNPIDPQAAVLVERPDTPNGLQAQGGVERILLAWQAIDASDLAGYAVFRAVQSNGTYAFVVGDGDSTLQITTGKVSFIDSLDAPGQTFFYRIAAVDTSGLLSERSNFVGATIIEDLVPPAPPANLSVVADESETGRIVVRWTLPRTDADGGPLTGLSGFVLFRAEDDQGYVPVDTLSADAQSYADDGLKALTRYGYRILSFDSKGNKSQLTAPQLTSTLGLPTPSNVVATGDIGRIEIRWSGVDNTDLLGYNVYRSTRSDVGFEALPSIEGADFTTGLTTYVDSGLVGGTSFFYKVQSIGRGTLVSEYSVFVGATALADEVAPGAPVDLAAVADENDFGRVIISWNAPLRDADSAQLTGLEVYTVYRSVDTNTSFVAVGQVDSGNRQLVDTGLDESTTYFYAVTASDEAGNEGPRSSPVQVRTKGPDRDAPQPPQNLSAIPSEEDFGRVVLRWNAPIADADGGELTGLNRFVVFRSKGGNSSFVPIDTVDVSLREYTDQNLEALTNYVYTVSALDEAGNESTRAQSVQVRTEGPDQVAPAAPQNLSAVADENDFGQVTVSWNASTLDSDGGQLTGLTGYTVFRSKGSTNSFQPVATVDATTRQYVDTGLEELTTYYYTVSAADDSGNESARAQSVQVRTEGPDRIAPAAPHSLSAVADEQVIGQVVLRWASPTLDAQGGQLSDLSRYILFRAKESTSAFVAVDTLGAEVRQYTDTGLDESTVYYYAVSALDAVGNESSRSAVVEVQTQGADRVPPAAPQNIAAIADEDAFGQVSISWSAPSKDADGGDVAGLASYTVFRSKGSTNAFQSIATVGVETREYVDTGLEELTTYYYAVSASDEIGNESARSGIVQVLTSGSDRVAPAAPQNLSAVADDDIFSQVSLVWSPPTRDANGEELTGLTRYVVFRSEGSRNAFVSVDTVDAATSAYVDTGLEELTTYYYTVSAIDGDGNESARAGDVSVVTGGPDGVAPQAPADLVALAASSAVEISLSWTPPTRDANGGDLTGLTAYVIMRSKGDDASFVSIDTVDAGDNRYTDSDGLESSTTYYYALRALDEVGNSSVRSGAASAKTAGIEAPSGLAANAGIRTITITWNASGEESLLGYNVYRSTRSDEGFTRLAGAEGTSFSTGQTVYVDSNLVGGQTYFYRASTVTSDGESEQSTFVGATVLSDSRAPAAPTLVKAEAVRDDPEKIDLSWNPPTTDINGAELTGVDRYYVYRADDVAGPYTQVATVTSTAYQDTGLVSVTTYYYQIEAIDQVGNTSLPSAAIAAITSGVEKPSDVRISASTPSDVTQPPEVTILWTGSVGAILHYELQRTTVANSTNDADFVVVGTNSLDTQRVDDTVLRGTTYYYRVRARDIDDRVSEWTDLARVDVKN